jgi:glycosyltransferase involved in cell wall biosynthesis
MRSLRVLHVTPYSGEAWAYGGIPRLADALVRGLARRGHDVTLCATDACDASTRLATTPTTTDGVTRLVFPNVSNRAAYHLQLFLPRGLSDYLAQAAGSFDVAHLHACRNLPGAIAAHHLRRAGVPYVLEPNGTAPRIERRRLAKRIFDVAAGRRVLRGASRIIAVSNAERAQLRSVGVDARAIRLVPNPVELTEFTPAPRRGVFRRRINHPTGPLVLFLGRLSPRKRVDVLLRSFARLPHPDSRLVIAGNDMGSERSARRLTRELGIEGRTTFTGLLRGSDRLEALADADVLVYPSQDEIFGLVPLEALLCGTPVIVADDSGCAEVVRNVGGGQIVSLGDVESLRRAIGAVLENADRWRAAAIDAAARVRATFARDIVCAQLDDVYQELVGAA